MSLDSIFKHSNHFTPTAGTPNQNTGTNSISSRTNDISNKSNDNTSRNRNNPAEGPGGTTSGNGAGEGSHPSVTHPTPLKKTGPHEAYLPLLLRAKKGCASSDELTQALQALTEAPHPPGGGVLGHQVPPLSYVSCKRFLSVSPTGTAVTRAGTAVTPTGSQGNNDSLATAFPLGAALSHIQAVQRRTHGAVVESAWSVVYRGMEQLQVYRMR